MAVRMLGKQKCGLVLVHVMSALVFTAGLLAVISLSVVLVQINSQNQCHLCDDVDKVSRGETIVQLLKDCTY